MKNLVTVNGKREMKKKKWAYVWEVTCESVRLMVDAHLTIIRTVVSVVACIALVLAIIGLKNSVDNKNVLLNAGVDIANRLDAVEGITEGIDTEALGETIDTEFLMQSILESIGTDKELTKEQIDTIRSMIETQVASGEKVDVEALIAEALKEAGADTKANIDSVSAKLKDEMSKQLAAQAAVNEGLANKLEAQKAVSDGLANKLEAQTNAGSALEGRVATNERNIGGLNTQLSDDGRKLEFGYDEASGAYGYMVDGQFKPF